MLLVAGVFVTLVVGCMVYSVSEGTVKPQVHDSTTHGAIRTVIQLITK